MKGGAEARRTELKDAKKSSKVESMSFESVSIFEH